VFSVETFMMQDLGDWRTSRQNARPLSIAEQDSNFLQIWTGQGKMTISPRRAKGKVIIAEEH